MAQFATNKPVSWLNSEQCLWKCLWKTPRIFKWAILQFKIMQKITVYTEYAVHPSLHTGFIFWWLNITRHRKLIRKISLLCPSSHIYLLQCYQKILGKLNLKHDKKGTSRTGKSTKLPNSTGNNKCLDFDDWRNDRKRLNFIKAYRCRSSLSKNWTVDEQNSFWQEVLRFLKTESFCRRLKHDRARCEPL